MVFKNKKVEIISFDADDKLYYPNYMKYESWMGDRYIKESDLSIPLGASRYGGCIVDLPEGETYPGNMLFAGQIDLKEFSKYDSRGLLPQKGQLIFFADILTDKGKVIFTETENKDLIRVRKEHDDNFFSGTLIKNIRRDTETFSEKFIEPEDPEQPLDENGKTWCPYEGSEKSKIFGYFTHCQYELSTIEEFATSSKVVLFQVGENGFNDEGLFSIVIEKEDLRNKNFKDCMFHWSQS